MRCFTETYFDVSCAQCVNDSVFCLQHNVSLTCTAVGTVREIVAVFAVTFHGHLELVLFICYAGVIVTLNLNSIGAVDTAVMAM